MNWIRILNLVLGVLFLLDGVVSLLFRERLETWARQVFPTLNVRALALAEIGAGGLLLAALYLVGGWPR
jgi:hypothetical protein